MTFVGIDIGTSFIKGAALDPDALRIRDVRRVPFPEPISGLPPFYREFDGLAVFAAVDALLTDLLACAADCEGIVMCGQMHGLIFVSASGTPCSTLTTWQDQRVLEPHPSGEGTYFDVMRKRLDPGWVRQLGNEVRPGQPLGVLFWLAEQGRLPDTEAIATSLPDAVVAHLCHTVPTTELTHAAAHGALNLATRDWHREVLARLGLQDVHWPTIRPQGDVCGTLQAGSHEIPCYTPVGDYQCALAGTLLMPGELSINMSTGSQVSLLRLSNLPASADKGDYQIRPFFDGRLLSTITHIPAGRALNALVSLLSELAVQQGHTLADPWPIIAREAATVGETKMRVDPAFFDSACGDHGEITHIREGELTVGHLFRAAFQAMADNYFTCALRLSPEQAWHALVLSGGLAQIDVLRQLIQGAFRRDYRLCPTTEDTLLGLLALAMAFTGRATSVEDAMVRLREDHL